MDRPWALAVLITVVALAPFTIFAVMRFVRAERAVSYKQFKKPVQTTGVIEWVDCINDPQGGSHYIITYSYTDNMGEKHTVAFRWHRRIGWPGDEIVIHFDSQDPESCIADCQVEHGRKIWRNTLIIIIAMFVFAVFGFLSYSK